MNRLHRDHARSPYLSYALYFLAWMFRWRVGRPHVQHRFLNRIRRAGL